jgi:ABC-type multidrug transport system fused ATPase/permease subunit
MGAISLTIIILSNVIGILRVYALARYSHMRSLSWSKKMYTLQINQSYETFIDTESAIFIRNVTTEPNEVVTGFIMPLGMVISSSITLIMMGAMLLWYDLYITLSIIAFFIVAFTTLSFFIKNKLKILGKQRITTTAARGVIMQETVRCFKDIRMAGQENEFDKRFSKSAKDVIDVLIKSTTYGQIPKYWIQTLFFGGLILSCIFLILQSGSDENLILEYIPTISLFGLAGQKLLPEIQALYSSRNTMIFALPAIENLYKIEETLKNKSTHKNEFPKINFEKNINFENITYTYPDGNNAISKPLSLTIKKGEKIGIMGPSGSGKSTFIDIVMGLLEPDTGTITLDGKVLDRNGIQSWRKNISQVPQDVSILGRSLKGNIAIGVENKEIDEEKIWKILGMVNLKEWAEQLPQKLDTNLMKGAAALSGGQKQRIGIARALYRDTDIIVLDEATSALDENTENDILRIFETTFKNKTTISIAHRKNTLKSCNRIIQIDKNGMREANTKS